MKKGDTDEERSSVATNRRAHHHYHILESLEAGLVLKGPEVKSMRAGQVSLDQGFALLERGELNLYGLYIAPYKLNTGTPLEPTRTRRLLVKRGELERLRGQLQGKGLTLIPLELYFKRGWAKVALGLAKGKRGPDKRESIKKRDLEREMDKSFKGRFRA